MASGLYKDGTMHDPKLPTAYRKSKSIQENCSNCAYLRNGNVCGLWRGASVRGAYVCGKYKDLSEGPAKTFPKLDRPIPEPVGLNAPSSKKTFSNKPVKRRTPPNRSSRSGGRPLQIPATSESLPPLAPRRPSQTPTPPRPNRNQQNRRSSGGGY